MDGRCGKDAERWQSPTWLGSHIWKQWHEYMQHPELDRNYSLVERTAQNKARLRLDFPGDGLSDDPRHMQLMLDMHFDALMRDGSHPALSP